MIARVLALALAVAAVFVAVHALRADHRCAALQNAAGHAPRAEMAMFARQAAERCGDPRNEAFVIGIAVLRGDRGSATALARRMTRQHPDDYLGWLGVYRLTGERDALARAHALNPRGVPLS